MHDNTTLNRNIAPIYFMDFEKESSGSISNHHADGYPTSVFESRERRWDSQTDLVRKCSFLERILHK